MRMDDRHDVRPLAVDPDVKAHAGIRSAAGERLQILVDQHHALARRFLEAVAELQRPPGPGPVGARGDLTGEAGFMAFAGEDATGAGKRVARRQVRRREIGRHFAAHAIDEVLLHFM